MFFSMNNVHVQIYYGVFASQVQLPNGFIVTFFPFSYDNYTALEFTSPTLLHTRPVLLVANHHYPALPNTAQH